MKPKQARIEISQEIDIAKAVYAAKRLACAAGFKETEQFMISTAASELARNIFLYALKGKVRIKVLERKTQKGIEVVGEDNGPGIKDIANVLKGGFSTGGTLGIGLSGVKRLMDEFVIDTQRKRGTKITVRKWV